MSGELLIDLLLVLAITTLAVLCLSVRQVFQAIILFISLGLLVTVSWVRLDAWDIAIAEAAIGAGLTGALLLSAWKKMQRGASSQPASNKYKGRPDV